MYESLSWSCRLLRALYSRGVSQVYLSPGSRSTPLVLAAATHPGFQCHIVLDERSAAFQALGCGKATGRPALLICTSGTAAANYHPAVIESKQAGIPLIVLTADRPPHLRASGSSQTIDQIKMFGDSVLMFHELGEPAGRQEDHKRLDLLALQATSAGGPVHINAPFRKPLEPTAGVLNREREANIRQAGGVDSAKPAGATEANNTDSVSEGPEPLLRNLPPAAEALLKSARNPLLIAGPDELTRGSGRLVRQLFDRLNLPVIAEPGAVTDTGLPVIRRYEMLLRSASLMNKLKPDLILRTGDRPFSHSLQIFEERHADVPVIQLLSRDTWQQAGGRVDHRVILRDDLLDLDGVEAEEPGWQEAWVKADQEAESVLERELSTAKAFTDGHVCHHLAGLLSPQWDLMLSNSFTVRDLSLFGPAAACEHRAFVNRGAAGIDGIVSTGIGLAHGSERRTAVLTGDLAFLHDSNALLSMTAGNTPLVTVVINNRGGNIFRMLPVREIASNYYTDYFETPQQVDIAHLAAAHGIRHIPIESTGHLKQLTLRELESLGNVIIECRTDPDGSMALRQSLWNAF